MPVLQKDLTCPQGTSFELQYDIELQNENGSPVNLSGFKASFHVRKNYNTPIIELDLTTENAGIMLSGDVGKINVMITPEMTNSFIFRDDSVDYVYDLDLIDPLGKVRRVVQGTFTITKNV